VPCQTTPDCPTQGEGGREGSAGGGDGNLRRSSLFPLKTPVVVRSHGRGLQLLRVLWARCCVASHARADDMYMCMFVSRRRVARHGRKRCVYVFIMYEVGWHMAGRGVCIYLTRMTCGGTWQEEATSTVQLGGKYEKPASSVASREGR